MEEDIPPNAMPVGGQRHMISEQNEYRDRVSSKKGGGGSLRITPKSTHNS